MDHLEINKTAMVNNRVGRKKRIMKIICNLRIVAACACLLATGMLDRTDGATLGKMQADKILFLGNSITFCPQPSSEDWWGLSATTPAKDYAHLLTQRINTTTGGSLTIVPPNPSPRCLGNRRRRDPLVLWQSAAELQRQYYQHVRYF